MVKIRSFITGAAVLALAACAAPENEMLDQARTAYSAARNDPAVIQNAPTELNQAAQTLQKAERLYEQDADQDRVTHKAYLANQQVAIAREATQLKMAQDSIAQAEGQRQQVLLQARSREAEVAKQEAARTQQQLEETQAQLSETERARQSELVQQQTQQLQREAAQARQETEAVRQQEAKREAEITQLRQQISEAKTRETPRGIVLALKDVVFQADKADLNPGATRTIGKIADFLRQHPERSVVIEGFTDSTGPTDYNHRLSDLRARAIRDALVQQGVDERRITARGFGEQYPVASNDTPAGRQLNRRVEIVIGDGAEAGSVSGAGIREEKQAGAAGEGAVQTGMMVRDRQGRDIGEVTEVMENFANGRASFARISSTAGKNYLVPLSALSSESEGNFVTLNADRSLLETSPLPRQGMSEEQYGRALYEHYGLSYPWEESDR